MNQAVEINIPEKLKQAEFQMQRGMLGEASGIAEDLMKHIPKENEYYAMVRMFRAVTLAQQNRIEEAVALGDEALSLRDQQIWHQPMAGWKLLLNRHEEALYHARKAESHEHNENASGPHLAMGRILVEMGERHRNLALWHILKAIGYNRYNPDAHMMLAEMRLRAGEWRNGWLEYEWRNQMAMAVELPEMMRRYPPWTGGSPPKNSKLLVICDQGYGDTIQFARFIPLCKPHFPAGVYLAMNSEVHKYLRRSLDLAGYYSAYDNFPAEALHVRVTSLAAALGIDSDPPPPLKIEPDPVKAQFAEMQMLGDQPPGLRVGLFWSGRPSHPNNRRRSTRLATFRPLIRPGVSFVSLQKPMPPEDLPEVERFPGMRDLSSDLHDFDDTVATLSRLDLLVTVDSGIAHLAASLGKPVWIVTPKGRDWRWQTGDRSVWYPTISIYSQEHHGDWTTPLAHVARDLREWVDQRQMMQAAE